MTSFLTSSICLSDKNAWEIAGDYLIAAGSRESALKDAVYDLASGKLADVFYCNAGLDKGTAFAAKEILFFIASRPMSKNEPNI